MAKKCCGQEINGLPVLDGCPAPEELAMTVGAEGGKGQGGYALRYWSDIFGCTSGGASITSAYMQLLVPDDLAAGEMGLVISLGAGNVPLQDSVWITLDGSEMPRTVTDRVSYGVVYGANDITINFIQETIDSQLYIIHYAYTSATP